MEYTKLIEIKAMAMISLWLFPATEISSNIKRCSHLGPILPPYPRMILADHNIVLWQVKFSSPPGKIYHADCFHRIKKSSIFEHTFFWSLPQTVSTSMFTLKHVAWSANFVRTMFSNKSLIRLNSMMSFGWHSNQNLSNSMKR